MWTQHSGRPEKMRRPHDHQRRKALRPIAATAVLVVTAGAGNTMKDARGAEGQDRSLALPNCTLASLVVWSGGSSLDFEPLFQSHVYNYRAVLDFAVEPIWVEPTVQLVSDVPASGSCDARRSDHGKVINPGGQGELLVSVNGAEPRNYSVILERRMGKDTALATLSVLGSGKLTAPFHPQRLDYDILLGSDGSGDQLELSCGPFDMGQRLEVMIEASQSSSAPAIEHPMRLALLRHRRRNFTLGRLTSGRSRWQLASGSYLPVPLRVVVRVWPAKPRDTTDAPTTYSLRLLAPGGDSGGLSLGPFGPFLAFLGTMTFLLLSWWWFVSRTVDPDAGLQALLWDFLDRTAQCFSCVLLIICNLQDALITRFWNGASSQQDGERPAVGYDE